MHLLVQAFYKVCNVELAPQSIHLSTLSCKTAHKCLLSYSKPLFLSIKLQCVTHATLPIVQILRFE